MRVLARCHHIHRLGIDLLQLNAGSRRAIILPLARLAYDVLLQIVTICVCAARE